jgi:hypothetical protein
MRLVEDVAEYLHWRKVNKHIKGGENYLSRFRRALEAPLNDGDVAPAGCSTCHNAKGTLRVCKGLLLVALKVKPQHVESELKLVINIITRELGE